MEITAPEKFQAEAEAFGAYRIQPSLMLRCQRNGPGQFEADCLGAGLVSGPEPIERIVVTDVTGAEHEIPVVDGWLAFAGTVVNHADSPGLREACTSRSTRPTGPSWLSTTRTAEVRTDGDPPPGPIPDPTDRPAETDSRAAGQVWPAVRSMIRAFVQPSTPPRSGRTRWAGAHVVEDRLEQGGEGADVVIGQGREQEPRRTSTCPGSAWASRSRPASVIVTVTPRSSSGDGRADPARLLHLAGLVGEAAAAVDHLVSQLGHPEAAGRESRPRRASTLNCT